MEKTTIEKERKQMIKYRIKQMQNTIKIYRIMIQDHRKELDFINGNYDKTWKEEYGIL